MKRLTPSEVLDMHRNVRESLADPTVRRYLDGFMRDTVEKAVKGKKTEVERWKEIGSVFGQLFHPANNPDQFAALLSKDLFSARTYQVTEEMVDAVSAMYRRSQQEGMFTVTLGELPSEAGFAWFDKPITHIDKHGKVVKARAISWGLQPVTYFTEDYTQEDIDRAMAGQDVKDGKKTMTVQGVRVVTWFSVTDKDEIWDQEYQDAWIRETHGRYRVLYSHSFTLPFGQRFSFSAEDQGDDMMAWIKTLWVFMNTEIVTSTRPHLRAFSMKKFQRSMKEPPEVNVIYLRRRHVDYDSFGVPQPAGLIDWSCRWVVQGHHRHLEKYPGPKHHALPDPAFANTKCLTCGSKITWVHPYVKGPDDKPVRALEQLYLLRQ